MAITGANKAKAAVHRPRKGTLIEAAVLVVSAVGAEVLAVPEIGAGGPAAGPGPEDHAPMLPGKKVWAGGSRAGADLGAVKGNSSTSTFRKGLPWRRYE